MSTKIKAKEIFKEYKENVQGAVEKYNILKARFPKKHFPELARRIWREGILAEMWGTIATNLNPSGVNHLDEWRRGL